MRERTRKKRTTKHRHFEIDLIVPGLGSHTGRPSDRFRCSAETRDTLVLKQRRKMIHDLGQRLLFDLLSARLDGRFTTERLEIAHKLGNAALTELVREAQDQLLVPMLDGWLGVCRAKDKRYCRVQILSFVAFCGGEETASASHLTSARIDRWLSSLVDLRRGRTKPATLSAKAENVTSRERRAAKVALLPPRNVTDATRNRYRATMSAFCTYLCNTTKVLQEHPIRGRKVAPFAESDSRLPDLTPEQWASYCAAITADPLAPPNATLVLRILRHTGADVGEVVGFADASGKYVAGMRVSDCQFTESLVRIRFKRTKVKKSPERFVPVPKGCASDLRELIVDCGLSSDDVVFGEFNRERLVAAHHRATKLIKKQELRLKDLRHLAAISWARAGTRLERIAEWLGHSNIKQTVVYSRFLPDDSFDQPLIERAANIALRGAA